MTHLFSVLHLVPKSTDCEERLSNSAPDTQASTVPQAFTKQLIPRLRETTLALQDGLVTNAFEGLKVNSFDNGKNKQKAIYISQIHRHLLSMDNELSAVLGTLGNTKGIQIHPPCMQSSVICRKAAPVEGTERDCQLMRETAVTMVIHFILRRTVDMKSSGQKIRNSRRTRVLKAREMSAGSKQGKNREKQ